MGPRKAATEDAAADLVTLARQIESRLQAIRRAMRQSLEREFARGNLTGPQQLVAGELVRADGLSLKMLSARVCLAHSTVSGIVDRLEKKGLVERHVSPTDRRVTMIVASKQVHDFLQKQMPELTLHPLVEALGKATPEQRKAVANGVDTLAQLLAERSAARPETEGRGE